MKAFLDVAVVGVVEIELHAPWIPNKLSLAHFIIISSSNRVESSRMESSLEMSRVERQHRVSPSWFLRRCSREENFERENCETKEIKLIIKSMNEGKKLVGGRLMREHFVDDLFFFCFLSFSSSLPILSRPTTSAELAQIFLLQFEQKLTLTSVETTKPSAHQLTFPLFIVNSMSRKLGVMQLLYFNINTYTQINGKHKQKIY